MASATPALTQAGALSTPPRLISSAFLLLGLGQGVPGMCPDHSPGCHGTQPCVPLSSAPPSPGLLWVRVWGRWRRTEEVGVELTSSTRRVLAQRLYFPCLLWPSTHPPSLRQQFSFPTATRAAFLFLGLGVHPPPPPRRGQVAGGRGGVSSLCLLGSGFTLLLLPASLEMGRCEAP